MIATASASAASGPAIFAREQPLDHRVDLRLFGIAVADHRFLDQPRGIFADLEAGARGDHQATPRAWPSFSVDCGFLLTNTSSTAAASGRCSAITASSWSRDAASRSGSGSPGSVFSWPLAIWLRRLPSARISPQPVVPSPGSRPRMRSGQLLQLLVGDVVIAPDGLDVVVLLERVDQLHQARRHRRRGPRPRSAASRRA